MTLFLGVSPKQQFNFSAKKKTESREFEQNAPAARLDISMDWPRNWKRLG
jgi:hypothetical protein